MKNQDSTETLQAPYVLEYTYQRSTGPVIGQFLTGLKNRVIQGAKTKDGRIIVPPTEYDPQSGDAIETLVKLPQTGTVETWTWVENPQKHHPLSEAFAWALIRIEGADTSILHAVKVDSQDQMSTGMTVSANWREERTGCIQDIAYFAPQSEAVPDFDLSKLSEEEVITLLQAPMRLDYTVSAGKNLTVYLNNLAQKKLVGTSCPSCEKTYIPPRGSCPTCNVSMGGLVELSDTGTITTFCIINIPFAAMPFPPPYAAVAILLDGADLPFFHLVREIETKDVRMGMRVKAQWVDDADLGPTLKSIKWFVPTGEPDAPFEDIAEHL
jgi:hypothetical protein